jgi:DNA-binding NarL/FixJ family response regulator
MTVHVVVVDDQLPFRQAMAAVVGATEGFAVVGEASSGEESIITCSELHPDLVLMDVNLPGMDGLEATRQLRALPSQPVVLLLSTYDADAGDDFAIESGAAAYVTKSEFSPERLAAAWADATR